jgi:hypothetical protein
MKSQSTDLSAALHLLMGYSHNSPRSHAVQKKPAAGTGTPAPF